MGLRRGFKKEATELATELRAELGLSPLARLDPRKLARHVEIPIMALSDLALACKGVHYFLSDDRETFSALTVFEDHRRIIVHNDAHSTPRQNSNLAHELSHGLLHHKPAPALDLQTGCRLWDATNEDEADWLAGELLVTRNMALAVARGGFTKQKAMERLQVSEKMLRWRMNVTGAVKQVERGRTARQAG